MLKKITNTILVLSVFFFINLSFSAQAQYQSPVNVYSGIATQRIMTQNNINAAMINGMIRSQMMSGLYKGGKKSSKKGFTIPPPDSLRYSQAAANSVVKPLAAQMSEKGNLEQQKEAEQIFQQALKLYRDTARTDHFPDNDIAYAFEFFLVQNYHIYHNVFSVRDDPSAGTTYDQDPNFINMEQERTLFEQFRKMFKGDAKFQKLTDKDKQQFTETMAIMSLIPWFIYDNGLKGNDPKSIRQAQAMAKENLENIFGTSADNIVVNDNGISFNK